LSRADAWARRSWAACGSGSAQRRGKVDYHQKAASTLLDTAFALDEPSLPLGLLPKSAARYEVAGSLLRITKIPGMRRAEWRRTTNLSMISDPGSRRYLTYGGAVIGSAVPPSGIDQCVQTPSDFDH
jgi:hypothetical protein